MKPKMDGNNIDMSKLWSSTQNLANNCKDEKGNSVFAEGMNPFDMLNKMMGKVNGAGTGDESKTPNLDGILKNLPIPPGMSEEQYFAQYSKRFNQNNSKGGKRPKN